MSRKIRYPFARKEATVLTALYHLNEEQRKALLRKADAKLVRRICECALNVLIGNVPLSKGHKSRLRKHAKILRKLAASDITAKKKKYYSATRWIFTSSGSSSDWYHSSQFCE